MSPLKLSNLTAVGPKKCNIAEAQDKDFKNSYYNILKHLKGDMNESIN